VSGDASVVKVVTRKSDGLALKCSMHASVCLDQRNALAVSPGSAYECVLAKRNHGLADKVKKERKE
jgi:hypothetical protein